MNEPIPSKEIIGVKPSFSAENQQEKKHPLPILLIIRHFFVLQGSGFVLGDPAQSL